MANKPWKSNGEVLHYYRCAHTQTIKKKLRGWKSWGQERGLWSDEVEDNLNKDLENEAAVVFQKIQKIQELNAHERMKWAQFVLSQLVRTPTFLKYEECARELTGHDVVGHPEHERVGCEHCGDLYWLSQRNWYLVVCDDSRTFVRSDNPVFLTGFIDRPSSAVFYPISPRLLWVASSMPNDWSPNWEEGHTGTFMGMEMDGMFAFMMNFYQIRSCLNGFIVHPEHDTEVYEGIAQHSLGVYPCPPFSLHVLKDMNEAEAFESIRIIMCVSDDEPYPCWDATELEPFCLSI